MFVAGDISQKVRRIIAEQTMQDIDDVKLESSPEELGLDSLKIVDIIFELEEEFDISIPFNFNDPAGSEFRMNNIGDGIYVDMNYEGYTLIDFVEASYNTGDGIDLRDGSASLLPG